MKHEAPFYDYKKHIVSLAPDRQIQEMYSSDRLFKTKKYSSYYYMSLILLLHIAFVFHLFPLFPSTAEQKYFCPFNKSLI